MDSPGTACPASKSKARINAYEQLSKETFEEREQEFEIQFAGQTLGQPCRRTEKRQQGVWETGADGKPQLPFAPGGIIGVIAPTRGQKPRCSACSPVKKSPTRAN